MVKTEKTKQQKKKKKKKKKQVPISGGNEAFVGKKSTYGAKALKYINASTLENISSKDSDQLEHPMDAIWSDDDSWCFTPLSALCTYKSNWHEEGVIRKGSLQ